MSGKLLLLKTQKNEVFRILRDIGLDPSNFSWAEHGSALNPQVTVSRLNYADGEFYFQFDYRHSTGYRGVGAYGRTPPAEDNHVCEFSPARGARVAQHNPGAWGDEKRCVVQWANALKAEIEAPDLWKQIEKFRPAFSMPPPGQLPDDPIPAYEAEQIAHKLRQIGDQMQKQLELEQAQDQFVRSRLDYLADTAKRQGRLTWVYTFVGVFVGIAFQLGLDPVKTDRLWQLVRNLFGPIIPLITGS